jgi:site-specific recombinase XerD
MRATRLQLTSTLAQHITAYLVAQRALGKRMSTEEKALRLLDRYLSDNRIDGIDRITSCVIDSFIASRNRSTPCSYNALVTPIRRYFRWMVSQEILSTSPVLATSRRPVRALRPYLFCPNDAQRLLAATAALPSRPNAPERGRVYRMIFVLLYGLGLRVGEACRLQSQDVDFDRQLLYIRNGKFSKDRLVPFGPKIESELRQFIHWRRTRSALPPESPMFTFRDDGLCSLHPGSVSATFRSIVPKLGLAIPPGTRKPHLHCLRHSFAVSTLLRWYRDGVDPNSRLLHLSTFLGHVSPAATAVYLTITDELLREANRRFARFAPTMSEVTS